MLSMLRPLSFQAFKDVISIAWACDVQILQLGVCRRRRSRCHKRSAVSHCATYGSPQFLFLWNYNPACSIASLDNYFHTRRDDFSVSLLYATFLDPRAQAQVYYLNDIIPCCKRIGSACVIQQSSSKRCWERVDHFRLVSIETWIHKSFCYQSISSNDSDHRPYDCPFLKFYAIFVNSESLEVVRFSVEFVAHFHLRWLKYCIKDFYLRLSKEMSINFRYVSYDFSWSVHTTILQVAQNFGKSCCYFMLNGLIIQHLDHNRYENWLIFVEKALEVNISLNRMCNPWLWNLYLRGLRSIEIAKHGSVTPLENLSSSWMSRATPDIQLWINATPRKMTLWNRFQDYSRQEKTQVTVLSQ